MKTRIYLLFFVLALTGSACERTLDSLNLDADIDSGLILNAMAIEGTPFVAYLSHAYTIDKSPSATYIDKLTETLYLDNETLDYKVREYYNRTSEPNAEVVAVINGLERIQMVWDEEDYRYESDYLPQPQDRIVVTAVVGSQEISAETVVPSKPKIEVVSHEIIANPEDMYGKYGIISDSDTLMSLTLQISDPGGDNYYRLRIRSDRDYHITTGYTGYDYENHIVVEECWTLFTDYLMDDKFYSDDPLFVDSRITKNSYGMPSNFTNIFDNSMIKGKDYTFTAYSPKLIYTTWNVHPYMTEVIIQDKPQLPPQIMVELQAISKDFYLFTKSLQVYQSSKDDQFAEPVHIHNNVKHGWGVLGALSYDRHIVKF